VTRFVVATSTTTLPLAPALTAGVFGSIVTAAPAALALTAAPATIFHGNFIAAAIAADMVGLVISAACLADMARRIIAAATLANVIGPVIGLVVCTVARGGRRGEGGKACQCSQRQGGMLGLYHGYSPGSARRVVGARMARTRRGGAYSRPSQFFWPSGNSLTFLTLSQGRHCATRGPGYS
jgi:hypothetical protein